MCLKKKNFFSNKHKRDVKISNSKPVIPFNPAPIYKNKKIQPLDTPQLQNINQGL